MQERRLFFTLYDVDWRFGKVLLIKSCWTICVDRAEEMTRGSVSGKMTQLEGLQTVKCDDDTISYDTSLSTFTFTVSLIMMFHWNHVVWGPKAMGGKTKIAQHGFAQEHSNGTGDTADLDDSNVVVGGGQGGREEVGGRVARAIVEAEEQEETEKK